MKIKQNQQINESSLQSINQILPVKTGDTLFENSLNDLTAVNDLKDVVNVETPVSNSSTQKSETAELSADIAETGSLNKNINNSGALVFVSKEKISKPQEEKVLNTNSKKQDKSEILELEQTIQTINEIPNRKEAKEVVIQPKAESILGAKNNKDVDLVDMSIFTNSPLLNQLLLEDGDLAFATPKMEEIIPPQMLHNNKNEKISPIMSKEEDFVLPIKNIIHENVYKNVHLKSNDENVLKSERSEDLKIKDFSDIEKISEIFGAEDNKNFILEDKNISEDKKVFVDTFKDKEQESFDKTKINKSDENKKLVEPSKFENKNRVVMDKSIDLTKVSDKNENADKVLQENYIQINENKYIEKPILQNNQKADDMLIASKSAVKDYVAVTDVKNQEEQLEEINKFLNEIMSEDTVESLKTKDVSMIDNNTLLNEEIKNYYNLNKAENYALTEDVKTVINERISAINELSEIVETSQEAKDIHKEFKTIETPKSDDKKVETKQLTLTEKDAKFFSELIKTSQESGQTVNETVNKVLEDVKQPQEMQQTATISKALADMISESARTNKPFRIDFDKNISVIIKIDREGKISAEFLPGDKAVEQYLRTQLPLLQQKFDKEQIEYKDLNYRQSNGGKQQRERRKRGE